MRDESEVDLSGKIGTSVFFLEHGEGCELREAKVVGGVGFFNTAGKGVFVSPGSPDATTFLPHDDGSSGILAHRKNPLGGNLRIAEEVESHESVVCGSFGIVENAS